MNWTEANFNALIINLLLLFINLVDFSTSTALFKIVHILTPAVVCCHGDAYAVIRGDEVE